METVCEVRSWDGLASSLVWLLLLSVLLTTISTLMMLASSGIAFLYDGSFLFYVSLYRSLSLSLTGVCFGFWSR